MSERDKRNLLIKQTFESFLVHPDQTVDDLEASPFVSRRRGSGINAYQQMTPTGPERLDPNDETIKKNLSFQSISVLDDDFLDRDAAMEMILKDQEINEKELTLQIANSNITGCSSWTPLSTMRSSVLSMPKEIDQSHVSIGEYMGMRSEPMGSLSDEATHSKIFCGCSTSTPMNVLNEMTPPDLTFTGINEFLTPNTPKFSVLWNPSFSSKFLNVVTPQQKIAENTEKINYFVGNTCMKNIERLRAEEKLKAQSEFIKLEASKSFENLSGSFMSICRCSDDTVLRNSSSWNSTRSGKGSVIAQWDVQPQEIALNSTKGKGRILLINNSAEEMKFKAKFNGNAINVSPFIGTVPAKGQIGLRITVIRAKRNAKKYVEDIVKLIVGNSEKIVNVKIFEEEKFQIPVKERSFVLF